ncbi:hypothetical protein KRR26_05350 [Corallococcus sp. M34]|uniref:hypothetical protein n=1 Tax=Citreicoccus inhibens TaxID=2849499 RepID=UPI0018F6B3F2|nr:hypothetical protein [Citreicoccus inhibens]MBU8895017.1 hypothetical protein [Citreicoccus inhibens]
MSALTLGRATALALALAHVSARAQEPASRPDERAMFGGDAPAPAPAATSSDARPSEDNLFGGSSGGNSASPAEAAATPADTNDSAPDRTGSAQAPDLVDRDAASLSGGAARNAFDTAETTDDPLKIGGQFYLRASASGAAGRSFSNTSLTAPTLVDGYFDARPTERLRGMVVGRLSYDPTRPSGAVDATATGGSSLSLAGVAAANPRVLLDQAWLRFDIERTVFLTVGKQHVKWGTGTIWNPTDFLSPQRRDPLAFVDLRTGASMIKVHVPWESKGWNFYGIAMLDNAGPADSLGKIGGALRAEAVFGPAEVGVSAVAQKGRKTRLGIDVSSAVGPIDMYGELALKRGSDVPVYKLPDGVSVHDVLSSGNLGLITEDTPTGLTPQATLGANHTFAYSENDTAVVGVEYFYNSTGYTTREAYPYLLFVNQFDPFYAARHYAALYLLLAQPGSLDKTTFNLFTLGNLSDRSFTTRLNVVHRALSYLTVEAYGSVYYGQKGGTFRLAMDLPEIRRLNPETQQSEVILKQTSVPAPTFDLGVGLRINI